ncbi:uncharacterized protein [Ptychodera flava]|uniref:uncharacterized protein n=1 Tax=Ptychodera flava TaxID=63121 RepID=UPI00396A2F38
MMGGFATSYLLLLFFGQVQSGIEILSLNKVATQSSEVSSGGTAPLAVDGFKSRNYRDASCSTTRSEDNPWWKVDLGDTYLVDRVIITNRIDCCPERLEGAIVRVGNEQQITENSICDDAVRLDEVTAVSIVMNCNDLTGRFVSVELDEPNRVLTLCEVEVYGDIVPEYEKPNITCPENVSIAVNIGMSAVAVTWSLPNATDNSGSVTVSGSHDPGSIFPIGTTAVSYEAVDPSGNNASCSFTIRVEDTESPAITCPADIDAIANDGMPSAVSVMWSPPVATDNSGNVIVSGSHNPGSAFVIGATVVSYEAVDSSGNKETCDFAVRVTDTEKPFIICPSNASTTANIENPSVSVFWPLPNATDNSGIVSLSSIHSPGSNFPIGLTVVYYEAVDPSGNNQSCSFTVRVEAVVSHVANDKKMSTAEAIGCIDRLSKAITGLENIVVSSEERMSISEDILQATDTCLTTWLFSTSVDEITSIDRDLVIQSVLKAVDELSKFVLEDTVPGSGPILMDTPSIRLHLESDSVENLTKSVFLGNGSGLRIPESDELFANQMPASTVNMICSRVTGKLFQSRIADDTRLSTDVIGLSFTNRDGRELEGKSIDEDILIELSTEPPPTEDQIVMEGILLDVDNVTYFGFEIEIPRLFHALIIWLENSHTIFGNTTAYVFDEPAKFSHNYIDYHFSVDVNFLGDHSTIFISEYNFLKTGKYFLTFTVPKHDVKFWMSVKQTMCGYMKRQSDTWAGDGCQASSASNLTTTVCLCNYATAFTSPTV